MNLLKMAEGTQALKPSFSKLALNKAKVRQRADLQRVSVAEPGEKPAAARSGSRGQASKAVAPDSAFVAPSPPSPTVRTWQEMSEVTAPAAADGAHTHKNA